jgi:N-acetylmuramoyl-L-alanine amidase
MLSRIILRSLLLIAFVACLGLPAAVSARSQHGRQLIVVLDPGHGGAMHYGDESGAPSVDGTMLEKQMTLKVAILTAQDLKQMGYSVFLTRTKDQPVNTPPRDWNGDGKISKVDEFSARTSFANRHHADVLVSIHFDGVDDQSIHGTHGYYSPARPFWRDDLRLATILTASVVSSLRKAGFPDVNIGVGTDAADLTPQAWPDYPWFLILGPARRHRVVASQMPGALIETLFMSSPHDDTAMHNPKDVAAMAYGYASGIRAYFHGRTTR